MSLDSLKKPFSRSDCKLIRQAVRRGWSTPAETQRRIVRELQEQHASEPPGRLRTAIGECLSAMAGSPEMSG